MSNKILTPIIIVLVVGAGVLFYFVKGPRQSTSQDGSRNNIPTFPLSPDVANPTPTPTPNGGGTLPPNTEEEPPESVVCTADAKQCPDGSYVSRTGPNCEFAACPTQSIRVPKTHNVSIQSFSYGDSIHVQVGDTVVWTNLDSAPHTVTGEGGLNSTSMYKDGTYSFTFKTNGTFNYYCTFHPYMKGTVVVSE